jgi:hypothetical protein
MSKAGTIDSPAKATVPVEHYISDRDVPSLVVDIDLTSLGVGTATKTSTSSTLRPGRSPWCATRPMKTKAGTGSTR